MSILKWQVSSSSNLVSFFIFMTYNTPVNFKLIVFPLWVKGSHQSPNFYTSSALSYSSCHFSNRKSVFLQILYHPSLSWKTTPLYFFRSNIKYFGQEQMQILENFECSGQISPNSCHFWNNRVFLQILHEYSGSWDIIPLYFLTKILYTIRSLSK